MTSLVVCGRLSSLSTRTTTTSDPTNPSWSKKSRPLRRRSESTLRANAALSQTKTASNHGSQPEHVWARQDLDRGCEPWIVAGQMSARVLGPPCRRQHQTQSAHKVPNAIIIISAITSWSLCLPMWRTASHHVPANRNMASKASAGEPCGTYTRNNMYPLGSDRAHKGLRLATWQPSPRRPELAPKLGGRRAAQSAMPQAPDTTHHKTESNKNNNGPAGHQSEQRRAM